MFYWTVSWRVKETFLCHRGRVGINLNTRLTTGHSATFWGYGEEFKEKRGGGQEFSKRTSLRMKTLGLPETIDLKSWWLWLTSRRLTVVTSTIEHLATLLHFISSRLRRRIGACLSLWRCHLHIPSIRSQAHIPAMCQALTQALLHV